MAAESDCLWFGEKASTGRSAGNGVPKRKKWPEDKDCTGDVTLLAAWLCVGGGERTGRRDVRINFSLMASGSGALNIVLLMVLVLDKKSIKLGLPGEGRRAACRTGRPQVR